MNWNIIKDAFNMVKSGAVKRIDGEGFSVYQAGTIIRVDIKKTDID